MLTVPVDIQLEAYISRATDGGLTIGTARQTQFELRRNQVPNLRSLFSARAARNLIAIGAPSVKPVLAEINYGRWCARCEICGGCEDVDPSEPIFLCVSCGGTSGFQMVVFPAEREQIERLLLKRAHIRNRNWKPGETLALLERENRQHHEV